MCFCAKQLICQVRLKEKLMEKRRMLKNSVKSIIIHNLVIFTLIVFATSCKQSDSVVKKDYESLNSETLMLETTSVENSAIYDVLDLEPEYDADAAIKINFDEKNIPDNAADSVSEDDENVILKSGGIYVLKGTLKDKRVKIGEGQGERVEIVLDSFIYNGDKDCVIYSPDKKCKMLIFLANGSDNVINLNTSSNSNEKVNEKAAMFANGDLSFNGKGRLTINTEFESCIVSKNDLAFIDGQYILNTKGDAIKSKEKLLMRSGNFNITSGDDAIKVTSEKEGYFYFENANLFISSGDKGISSDNEVHIVGGEINLDSKGEGICGKLVDMSGGNVKIKSGDDGINANDNNQNKKDNQKGVYIKISGGKLKIDAEKDGIDSNGDLLFEGGNLFISGADNDNERIIDYNGNITLLNTPGMNMIGVGPGAKMQDFGDNAKQNYIVVYYDEYAKVMTTVEVADENGNMILSYEPNKPYKAALITSPKLVEGKTYIVSNYFDVYKNGEDGKEYKVNLVKGRNELRVSPY